VIEIRDTAPDVDVQAVEYIRLLGYPRGWELRDRAKELGDWAREWFSTHGRPWVYAREGEKCRRCGGRIRRIDGVQFTSTRVRTPCSRRCLRAILLAASAGPELEEGAGAVARREAR
jgi:hypothetical protein